MDVSNPAVLVNAEALKRFTGRRVRCVLKVVRLLDGNAAFIGLAPDGMELTVHHSSSASPPSLNQFVEVIGVADSDRSLRADLLTHFGDSFDMSSFNQLVQMANAEYQPLFI